MMSLDYFVPPSPLRGLVSTYYLFKMDGAHIAGTMRAELAQIRFMTSGQGRYCFADGRIEPALPAQLTGPTSAPVMFEASGPLIVVGAGLMPAGWAALVGHDAAALSDRILPLEAIAGPTPTTATLEHLRRATTDAERIGALNALFNDLLIYARPVPLWFTRATDKWLTASRAPAVDNLLIATGVSARQVERLSRRIYGGSPKFMARKYRALQAAVRIGTGQESWTEAAEGFYDQSHFIKEFKTFVGMTPKRFAVDPSPLTRETIMGRRHLPGLSKLALYS